LVMVLDFRGGRAGGLVVTNTIRHIIVVGALVGQARPNALH
jgi:hypothetical protein